MLKNLSLLMIVLSCVAATQTGGCSSTQKSAPDSRTESGAITKLADAAEDITRDAVDIAVGAETIKKEAVQADARIDKVYTENISPESKDNLDAAIDSLSEIKGRGDRIIDASKRIEYSSKKLETVANRIEDIERRLEELEKLEQQGHAAAMQKLYGYITLFWVLGFIVIAGGAAFAVFANKKIGVLLMFSGAVMLGFASASQYYLKEIALIGGILLGLLIIGGLLFMLWGFIKANKNETAMREVIEMIEILKETMTDSERERIFGENGVASHVQSDFTKELIAKIKEKNGFKKLEQARNIARTETQPQEGQTP